MSAQTESVHGAAFFEVDGRSFRATDVRRALGEDFHRLPIVLRLLAENTLRKCTPAESARMLATLAVGLRAGPQIMSFSFGRSGRLCMTQRVPRRGWTSPLCARRSWKRVSFPQHSVRYCASTSQQTISWRWRDTGVPTAARRTLAHVYRRNRERYRFLKWASENLDNVHINAPGTGIAHTINLEQLDEPTATR